MEKTGKNINAILCKNQMLADTVIDKLKNFGYDVEDFSICKWGETIYFKYNDKKIYHISTFEPKSNSTINLADTVNEFLYYAAKNLNADYKYDDFVGPSDAIGEISGFPIPVMEQMLIEQYKQGNQVNITVFQNNNSAPKTHGGFDWAKTKAGHSFWYGVIHKNFENFYKIYDENTINKTYKMIYKEINAIKTPVIKVNSSYDADDILLRLKKEGFKIHPNTYEFYKYKYIVVDYKGNIGTVSNSDACCLKRKNRYLTNSFDEFFNAVETIKDYINKDCKEKNSVNPESSEKPVTRPIRIANASDCQGNLKDFPLEIINRMMYEQYMQGNIMDPTVFQTNLRALRLENGFDWISTEAGYEFWTEVLDKKNFVKFFIRYGTKNDDFSKNILKPGMIVIDAASRKYLVMKMMAGTKEELLFMNTSGYNSINSMTDDLKCKYDNTYDIEQIYDTCGNYGNGFNILSQDVSDFKLVASRNLHPRSANVINVSKDDVLKVLSDIYSIKKEYINIV